MGKGEGATWGNPWISKFLSEPLETGWRGCWNSSQLMTEWGLMDNVLPGSCYWTSHSASPWNWLLWDTGTLWSRGHCESCLLCTGSLWSRGHVSRVSCALGHCDLVGSVSCVSCALGHCDLMDTESCLLYMGLLWSRGHCESCRTKRSLSLFWLPESSVNLAPSTTFLLLNSILVPSFQHLCSLLINSLFQNFMICIYIKYHILFLKNKEIDNRTEQLWREIHKGEPGKFWAPASIPTPYLSHSFTTCSFRFSLNHPVLYRRQTGVNQIVTS